MAPSLIVLSCVIEVTLCFVCSYPKKRLTNVCAHPIDPVLMKPAHELSKQTSPFNHRRRILDCIELLILYVTFIC